MEAIGLAYTPDCKGSTRPFTSRMMAVEYLRHRDRADCDGRFESSSSMAVRRASVDSSACGRVVIAFHADSWNIV